MADGPTRGTQSFTPKLKGAVLDGSNQAEIFGFIPGDSGITGTAHTHVAALGAAGTAAIGPFEKGSSVELEVATEAGAVHDEIVYYRGAEAAADVPVADGTSPFWTVFDEARRQFHLLGNQQYITLLNPSAAALIVSSKRMI